MNKNNAKLIQDIEDFCASEGESFKRGTFVDAIRRQKERRIAEANRKIDWKELHEIIEGEADEK